MKSRWRLWRAERQGSYESGLIWIFMAPVGSLFIYNYGMNWIRGQRQTGWVVRWGLNEHRRNGDVIFVREASDIDRAGRGLLSALRRCTDKADKVKEFKR